MNPAAIVPYTLLSMFFLLFAGIFAGRLLSAKVAIGTYIALAVMAAYGTLHHLIPYFSAHHADLSTFPTAILVSMGPLYLGMGIFLGRSRRSSTEQYQVMLAGWQKQLDLDLANRVNDLIVVHDLRTIAEIYYYRLGNKDEAVKALDRANAIVQETCATHPSAASFFWFYASVLRSAKRKDDAKRVEAQAKGLPSQLTSMSTAPSR